MPVRPAQRRLRCSAVLFVWFLIAPNVLAAGPHPPIVAGYERFFAGKVRRDSADGPIGGRILLGELHCTACHKPADDLNRQLLWKQAPVLDGIGSRVSLAWLRKFLVDPHAVKPGTTMPRLFAGLPERQRKQRVEALVHFLASTGSFHHTFPNVAAAGEGRKLFHTVGCVACHGAHEPGAKNPPGVVPLGNPAEKYSVRSLTAFLRDPLQTRPAGRMPGLNLSQKEANAIASWFLKDVEVPANLAYRYYEGTWRELPDFSRLKAKASGGAAGFNLKLARRNNNFALRFEGFLQAPRDGEYTFFLGSDDGSKLYLDGKLAVNNDGEHAYQERTGRRRLARGPHAVAVEFAQIGGGAELRVEFRGPGLKRQPLSDAVTSTKVPPRPEPGFRVDPKLAARGRELFASVGCASCHQLRENGRPIASKLTARPLSALKFGRGCTAVAPTSDAPHFELTPRQTSDMALAVRNGGGMRKDAAVIRQTMTAMNCYACHSRNKIGGPPDELDARFVTTTKEMGDEGRVPPPLDGVADKLTDNWLKHVLDNGADDRPYMLTRMPKFGLKNVGHLIPAFVAVDRKTLVQFPKLDVPPLHLKAFGRKLVGEEAFSCIKCHTFGRFKATGIQSLDLTQLTTRIREDWFFRYMMRPNRYRPGTRMPTPFPGGISTMDKVLDGKPDAQLTAMWTYLKDGNKARVPLGLIRGGIPLKPTTEPIIYRNFIQGLSPRGIAVGYPGGLNLAFDADRMVLGLIWHGAFIDASKHWQGRGSGFQEPLGDHVVSLPRDVPFAALESIDKAWPKDSAKEAGYRFAGYRLNGKRQPTFRYWLGEIAIDDFPQPVKGEIDPSLKRTFVLRLKNAGHGNPPALVYLAAVSTREIKPLKDGWYDVDRLYRVRVNNGSNQRPIVRKSGGRWELLVPVEFHGNTAKLVHEYVW